MLLSGIKRVLILAPHPDDAEFGLGGTIQKMNEQDIEIHVAIFSLCEKSTPAGFEVGVIEQEMYASMKFLKIPMEQIHVLNFEVRIFPALRQEILESLIVLKGKLKPDLVFVPSSSDLHQDHQTIHQEGVRAFKHCNLLGYEMPWNNIGFTSFVYFVLTEAHIEKKIEAIKLYKSQGKRKYSSPEFIRSLATIRGGQIHHDFAESFELIRFIQP
jgi:LmbE family N-acetylglucosaminyl deacetylase